MAVLVETSLGFLTVDLHFKDCPLSSENFLRLCMQKRYNNVLVFNVRAGFLAQTGDPTGTGAGGNSSLPQGNFPHEIRTPKLDHASKGTVGMIPTGNDPKNPNGSSFYITLRDGLSYMDGSHTIFGTVAEDSDKVLEKLSGLICDKNNRPTVDVRIKHTYILYDPFNLHGTAGVLFPPSPAAGTFRPEEEVVSPRRQYGESFVHAVNEAQYNTGENKGLTSFKEAASSATTLEILGDLPDVDAKPPENVLFVCKLNPVTDGEALELIFSRFGKVLAANVVRDFKTGDSLCYAFVEFAEKADAEEAYYKCDGILLDDRRIRVDFSQSLAKEWDKWRSRWRTFQSRQVASRRMPVFTSRHVKQSPAPENPVNTAAMRQSGNYQNDSSEHRSEHRYRHSGQHRHREDRHREYSTLRRESEHRRRGHRSHRRERRTEDERSRHDRPRTHRRRHKRERKRPRYT